MKNYNIIKNLILNIKFIFNIQNNLIYNFKIFIYKFNIKNNSIINCIENFKYNYIFNFRNKLNFNKSKKNITNKKRTGNSRLGSCSSHIFKNGIQCFGFKNIKLKKVKFYNNILYNLLINKKNELYIINLELIKFIYNIFSFNNFYKKNFNKFNNYNIPFNEKIKNCNNLINKKLNLVY